MGVINVVAQFERDLLVERTQSGLKRAKSAGQVLGRPQSLNFEQHKEIAVRLAHGESVSALARQYQTSRQTIMRVRDRGR
jgi:putative DNA-invertase from lambdoid prophage Rac